MKLQCNPLTTIVDRISHLVVSTFKVSLNLRRVLMIMTELCVDRQRSPDMAHEEEIKYSFYAMHNLVMVVSAVSDIQEGNIYEEGSLLSR